MLLKLFYSILTQLHLNTSMILKTSTINKSGKKVTTQKYEESGKLKVVDRPTDKEILSILELFKYKYDNLNKKVKAKVRIVVRGDLEKNDFDPNLIYAPVAGLDIIRLVLIICHMYGLYIVQIDIKTFLTNC